MAASLITYKDIDQLPDEDAIVIFNHIPKCGGITLRGMFTRYYENGLMDVYHSSLLDFPNRPEETPANANSCSSPAGTEHDASPCYVGHDAASMHHLLPSRKRAFYFTFLRHPFSRAISSYTFHQSFYPAENYAWKDMRPDNFLRKDRNGLIQFLGNGDKYLAEKTLFESYAFFGLQECFQQSLQALCKLLPWLSAAPCLPKNVSPKGAAPFSAVATEYFYERNRDDIDLYEKAEKEFRRRHGDVCPEKTVWVHPPEFIRSGEELLQGLSDFTECRPSALALNMIASSDKDHETLQRLHASLSKAIAPSYCLLFHLFLYSARLEKKDEAFSLAERLFSRMCDLDPANAVPALVRDRLVVLRSLVPLWDFSSAAPFPAAYAGWLEELRGVRTWQGPAALLLAKIAEHSGDSAGAAAVLRTTFDTVPENDDLLYELCRIELAAGDVRSVTERARRELEKNPDSERAPRCLALALCAEGRDQEAETALLNCLERDPCWIEGALRLSKLYSARGDDESARALGAGMPRAGTRGASLHSLRLQSAVRPGAA